MPLDLTGDGQRESVGYDTTGDGRVDALDTNGDGALDARIVRNVHVPGAQPVGLPRSQHTANHSLCVWSTG